ncbi:MAG: multidrug transporter, partial [Clostridia bacterium]|nr:multidrug transporter [Clostridia bacterium]
MKQSYIYGLTTVAIWSTLAAVVKTILRDIPNFEALAVSSIFAFLFLLSVNIVSGSIKKMRRYRAKDY